MSRGGTATALKIYCCSKCEQRENNVYVCSHCQQTGLDPLPWTELGLAVEEIEWLWTWEPLGMKWERPGPI